MSRSYKLHLGPDDPQVPGWRSDAATPKQLARLSYFGVLPPGGVSKGQAGAIIDKTEADLDLAPKLAAWHRDKYRLHPDLYPPEPRPSRTRDDGRVWQGLFGPDEVYHHDFRKPNQAQIVHILTRLDEADPDWDKRHSREEIEIVFLNYVATNYPEFCKSGCLFPRQMHANDGPAGSHELILQPTPPVEGEIPVNLYIARDGESLGPYSVDQTREYLEAGIFSPDELACRQGEENWLPLANYFPRKAPRLPRPAHISSLPTVLPEASHGSDRPTAGGGGSVRNSFALLMLGIVLVLFGASQGMTIFALVVLALIAIGIGGLVLAIVGLVKGRVAAGILLLIGWVALMPLWTLGGWSYALRVSRNQERAERVATAETVVRTETVASPPSVEPERMVARRETVAPAPEPTPTPRERRLSAPDTFFLTEYISVKTKGGVAGFEPGTLVRFVKANQDAGTLTVTDGKYQVDVRPDQLTNDLEIADLIHRSDQASQQTLRATQEQAYEDYLQTRKQVDLDHARNVAAANRPPSPTATRRNPLDQETVPTTSSERATSRNARDPYSYLRPVSSLRRVGGG